MKKLVLSVIGADRPGIVAAVSAILFENRCNIEDVSQTLLQTAFAGIFIITLAEGLAPDVLESRLRQGLESRGLHFHLEPLEAAGGPGAGGAEPFVVTTMGSDRLGLVAGVTGVMARYGVNITGLKAVFRGGDDPMRNVMIYEVDVPSDVDRRAFREALHKEADALGLDLSIQHRDIFESIHRV
ncbi:MAG: amino acid-binding protein [Deltaproteobacteria bacterium]|nr:amino acid-binding protein [Deltaproteobacteria bacterium]MBW1924178.1 amino acid-binding protein [Deltaproteobacteria bacterium]MBW1951036.1 amino acid-binding protein [Deltaproteobacteria bacterium]MBW2009128.1 amino acid-binding protein [Deltaproteobacteria bacterium]MBW2104234.1 amino acid-binding protein [Deltaproteobacteria bacterium]